MSLLTHPLVVGPLIGGALIGLAAAGLLLFNGRIAGISGILGGCLELGTGDKDWRIAFIAGLVLAPRSESKLPLGCSSLPLP
jgi:uncharacterized membrane protein YedE/YeeE